MTLVLVKPISQGSWIGVRRRLSRWTPLDAANAMVAPALVVGEDGWPPFSTFAFFITYIYMYLVLSILVIIEKKYTWRKGSEAGKKYNNYA